MKRRVSSLLLAMILPLMLTACGSGGSKTIVINYTLGISSSVTQVMKAKGFLEKRLPENVTVEWTGITTAPDIRDAIVSGKVDIADMSLSTYITSTENDLPLMLLSQCTYTNIRIYSKNSGIRQLSDIQPGSRIAITNKGTTLHTAFLAYCQETLGSAMQYDGNLVPIPAADALASLQTSDEFDVAIFSFPNYLKAEQQVEGLTLLADMGDVIKEYDVGTVYFTNSDFYKKTPDIVEAFLAAQQETLQFMQENSVETAEILSELYGVDSAEIQEALKLFPLQAEINNYDKHARLLYEAGILTKEPRRFEELPNYDKLPK